MSLLTFGLTIALQVTWRCPAGHTMQRLGGTESSEEGIGGGKCVRACDIHRRVAASKSPGSRSAEIVAGCTQVVLRARSEARAGLPDVLVRQQPRLLVRGGGLCKVRLRGPFRASRCCLVVVSVGAVAIAAPQ